MPPVLPDPSLIDRDPTIGPLSFPCQGSYDVVVLIGGQEIDRQRFELRE
jgi:hypothetical protein